MCSDSSYPTMKGKLFELLDTRYMIASNNLRDIIKQMKDEYPPIKFLDAEGTWTTPLHKPFKEWKERWLGNE